MYGLSLLGISITVGMDSLCLLIVERIISAIYGWKALFHPYKLVNNNNTNISSLNKAIEHILNLLGLRVYTINKFVNGTGVFNVGLPHCRQTLCHLSHQGSQNRYQMRQSLLWGVKKGDLVWGCSVGSEVGFFLSSQNEWRLEYKNPWISGNVMLAVLLSAALNERFIHLFSHSKTIHWQCSRCQAMF